MKNQIINNSYDSTTTLSKSFVSTLHLDEILPEYVLNKYGIKKNTKFEVAIDAVATDKLELFFFYRLEGQKRRLHAFQTTTSYNGNFEDEVQDAIACIFRVIDWEYALQITTAQGER